MQIHNVQTTYEDRWVLDPDKGAVKRREALMKPAGTHTINVPAGVFDSMPEGGELHIDADGSFHDVPDDVAAFFLRLPDWQEGLSPFPPDDLKPPAEVLAPPKVTGKAKEKADDE